MLYPLSARIEPKRRVNVSLGNQEAHMTTIPLVTWYAPMRRRARPSLWRQQLRWLPIWWHALWARR